MRSEGRIPGRTGRPALWLRVLAALAGIASLVAVFFLSLLVLATLLVVGVLFGGYLWWKTRALRARGAAFGVGPVIEGEIIEAEIIEAEIIEAETIEAEITREVPGRSDP